MNSNNPELERALRKLFKEVGIPLKKAAEILDVSSKEILDWWSGRACLRYRDMSSLVRLFGLTDEDIIAGRYHSPFLRSLFFSNGSKLPERYAENGFSKVRTSLHIVKLLNVHFDNLAGYKILADLGISPAYFDNPENEINLMFFEDLLSSMRGLGVYGENLKKYAYYLALNSMSSAISDLFSEVSGYRSFYDEFSKSSHLFESNFRYEFYSNCEGVHIKVVPTEALLTFRGNDTNFTKDMCDYRRYAIGSLAMLGGLPPVDLLESESFYKGDPVSHYFFPISREQDYFRNLRLSVT